MPPRINQNHQPNSKLPADSPPSNHLQPLRAELKPCSAEESENLSFTEKLALRDGILRNDNRTQLETLFFAGQNNSQTNNASNSNNAPNNSGQTTNSSTNSNQNLSNQINNNQSSGGVIDSIIEFGKDSLRRDADATRQVLTGIYETGRGVVMNEVEALKDLDEGFANTFIGAIKIAASPNEEQKQQDREDFAKGIEQLKGAWIKANPTGINQTTLDATLMLGGRIVSAVQTEVGLEQPGRSLTPDEQAELQKVFGNSVDYSQIYIKESFAGVATWASDDRALTHGNTIYMKVDKPNVNDPKYKNPQNSYQKDLADWYSTLAHETTHIWQNQNGGTDYMSEAMLAQRKAAMQDPNGRDDASYNYVQGIKEGKKWAELNPEQQAKLIQDAYDQKFFDKPNAKFTAIEHLGGKSAGDATAYINEVIRQMRNGEGAS